MPEDTILPQVKPGAQLLKPPPPIMQTEANWPLLTVSKGFFEGIKAVRGGAGPGLPVVQAAPSALDMGDEAMDISNAGAGWDDEDEAGFGDEEGEKFEDAEADGDGEGEYFTETFIKDVDISTKNVGCQSYTTLVQRSLIWLDGRYPIFCVLPFLLLT